MNKSDKVLRRSAGVSIVSRLVELEARWFWRIHPFKMAKCKIQADSKFEMSLERQASATSISGDKHQRRQASATSISDKHQRRQASAISISSESFGLWVSFIDWLSGGVYYFIYWSIHLWIIEVYRRFDWERKKTSRLSLYESPKETSLDDKPSSWAVGRFSFIKQLGGNTLLV